MLCLFYSIPARPAAKAGILTTFKRRIIHNPLVYTSTRTYPYPFLTTFHPPLTRLPTVSPYPTSTIPSHIPHALLALRIG